MLFGFVCSFFCVFKNSNFWLIPESVLNKFFSNQILEVKDVLKINEDVPNINKDVLENNKNEPLHKMVTRQDNLLKKLYIKKRIKKKNRIKKNK
jgi:hypothetical protein